MIEYGKAICYSGYRKGQCPDEKQEKSEQELKMNAERNDREVEKLIAMVKEFPEEIFAVSIGNENTPSWGKRIVPVERLMMHAKRFKEAIDKPVTFCEGVLEWKSLQKLAELMDFISIHSYPLHYGNTIDESWKGEAEDSCECNWGLYYESRQPKPVIASLKSK